MRCSRVLGEVQGGGKYIGPLNRECAVIGGRTATEAYDVSTDAGTGENKDRLVARRRVVKEVDAGSFTANQEVLQYPNCY